MSLLLDTHIWYRYLVSTPPLADSLTCAVDEASPCWLSPISLWELGILVQRGRIELDRDVRDWVDRAMERVPVREAHLNREVALLSNEVELPHRDPADRFLAAMALVFELTLVTLDEHLQRADWLPTLPD